MEWTVVTVIIALVGVGIAVIKPIVSLTNTITKLTVVVDALEKNLEELTGKNREAHIRLWKKNEEQDAVADDHEKRLTDHDKRITVIENKN